MSKSVAFGLIAVGIVLLVVAGLEHLLLRVELVPHLAIYLGVVAVLVAAAGAFGLVTGKPKSSAPADQPPTWP